MTSKSYLTPKLKKSTYGTTEYNMLVVLILLGHLLIQRRPSFFHNTVQTSVFALTEDFIKLIKNHSTKDVKDNIGVTNM